MDTRDGVADRQRFRLRRSKGECSCSLSVYRVEIIVQNPDMKPYIFVKFQNGNDIRLQRGREGSRNARRDRRPH